MRSARRAVAAALALWTSVLAPLPADADAADDLRAIRTGTQPVRVELLGWTAAREAVFRTLVCGESGTAYCRAAVTTVAPGRAAPRVTLLLDVSEVYCDQGRCDALTTEAQREFVDAEARARAALPPLATA
ncbi:MAG: hypothetical protein K1X94_24240, partial [Sandaracinaceae bacterium]|nr:hypothetical protein [Sandaracinaceae bacterium]